MNHTDKDKAHIRFTLDVVLDANGDDHDYLALRLNSAFNKAINSGVITAETAAGVDTLDAKTILLTPEAASLDEEQISRWIGRQIVDGHLDLERMVVLMSRYALADPAQMREELAERMKLAEEESLPSTHKNPRPS